MIKYLTIVLLLIQIVTFINCSSIQNMFVGENDVSNSKPETDSNLRGPSSIAAKPKDVLSSNNVWNNVVNENEEGEDEEESNNNNTGVDTYVITSFSSSSSPIDLISSLFKTLTLFLEAPTIVQPSLYYETLSSTNDDDNENTDDDDADDADTDWYAEDQGFKMETNQARAVFDLDQDQDSNNQYPSILDSLFGPLFL